MRTTIGDRRTTTSAGAAARASSFVAGRSSAASSQRGPAVPPHLRAFICTVCKLLLVAVLLVLAARSTHAQESEREPQIHVVQPGETLYRIARGNGLTVEELQRLNDLEDTTIRAGQRLVVGYQVPGEQDAPPPSSSEPATRRADMPTHPARPGETFYSIALRYGTTADTLLALNDGQTAPLEPGQAVRLPASFGPATHSVQPDETLHGVAQHYDLDVDELRDINRLPGDTLRAGQTLRIPARRVPVAPRPGTLPPPDTTGAVARYPETFAGRLTASGEPYDPEQFTASHPALPFGTVLLLTSPATGYRTFAVVNDRGPITPSYLLDVSDAVIEALEVSRQHTPKVRVHVIR